MITISLSQDLEKFIEAQIERGIYSSADEVVTEALKLLEEQQRKFREEGIEILRQKLASGTEQINQGRVTDGETVFAQLQDKIRRISDSQA
jgi:antitoxin ParD1/3/4